MWKPGVGQTTKERERKIVVGDIRARKTPRLPGPPKRRGRFTPRKKEGLIVRKRLRDFWETVRGKQQNNNEVGSYPTKFFCCQRGGREKNGGQSEKKGAETTS